MNILLSEGSGLTSRQVATRLGELGHHVEILSSTRICLTRFTRHVRRLNRVPSYARSPLAWLDAANAVARQRAIDVLFPTQEQVAVLSAARQSLAVATVVPDFGALRCLQDKVSAFRTLERLGVPQPRSVVVSDPGDLGQISEFPVFVKRPISTASTGVRKAASCSELYAVTKSMGLGAGELLVQLQCEGPLAMVQAVADAGRLIAWHANLRLREGAGGGAALKESVALPVLRPHLEALLGALAWTGALSMDVIVTAGGPMVIDVNPRLVEPMNAHFAGVDLVSPMLELAQMRHPGPQREGMRAVRSRQLLLALLGAAEASNSRTAVARTLIGALCGHGELASAAEELTPAGRDPCAALPVLVAAAATLAWPRACKKFHAGAVAEYALTPHGWQQIIAYADSSAGG